MLGPIFLLMSILAVDYVPPTPAEEDLVETFLKSVHYASATKYTTEFPKSIKDSVNKIPSELAAKYNEDFQRLHNAYKNPDLVKTIKDIRAEYDRQRREENQTEPFIRYLNTILVNKEKDPNSGISRSTAGIPDTPPVGGEDECCKRNDKITPKNQSLGENAMPAQVTNTNDGTTVKTAPKTPPSRVMLQGHGTTKTN